MRLRTALLLLAVGSGACRNANRQSVKIDPVLEELAPPDTKFVIGADLDSIRDTNVFRKYLALGGLPMVEEFAQKTGVDPRTDLSQLLYCSGGNSGLLLARGQFSKHAKEEAVYKGYPMLGSDQSAVLFLNNSTAIAGPAADVRAIVDLRGQGSHGLPSELKAKAGTIAGNYQLWAAFVGGTAGLNLGVPQASKLGQLVGLFRGLQSGTIALDLLKGLALDARFECESANAAKHIHDAIKGVVGFARLSIPDSQPQLIKVYEDIQVEQKDTLVTLRVNVPADFEDQFIDLWLKKR